MDTPFDVLSVDPDASDAEIDNAYRRRVLETHPDQGGSAAEFQRVREAYEQVKAGELVEPESEWDESSGDGASTTGDDVETGAADADAPDGEGAGDGDADTEPDGRRVEFLNYDVLSDHGWTLDDDDLFEKASAADLDPEDYGRVLVKSRESLLEAVEERGFQWPYSCRGGACANCAVAVTDGEMEMPSGQILTPEYLERGIRLSCISAPTEDGTQVVFNVKHLPGLDELRLPPRGFDRASFND